MTQEQIEKAAEDYAFALWGNTHNGDADKSAADFTEGANYVAAKIAELEAQLAKAEAVVEFYADQCSWTSKDNYNFATITSTDCEHLHFHPEDTDMPFSDAFGGKLARLYRGEK